MSGHGVAMTGWRTHDVDMSTLSDERDGAVEMTVRVWGMTDADVEHALYKAAQGDARRDWKFTGGIERLPGATCPIDVCDPRSAAAEEGYHWAYAVYPVAVDG